MATNPFAEFVTEPVQENPFASFVTQQTKPQESDETARLAARYPAPLA